MPKKYGDVVTYVRNGLDLNALVIQSNPGPAGEELVMTYLDPALGAVVIRDMSKVAARTFSIPPLVEGAAQGWKDHPDTAVLEGDLAEAEHQLAKHKDTIDQLVLAAQQKAPGDPNAENQANSVVVFSRPECVFAYCPCPEECANGCVQKPKPEASTENVEQTPA